MYRPKLKDWPYSHIKLMHLALSVLVLALCLFWLLVYPRWRKLEAMKLNAENVRRELEKSGVQLDENILSKHISDCIASLAGDEAKAGLVDIAGNAIATATQTFADEINAAYPVDANGGGRQSSLEKFVEGSTRIDYKDLYDRVTSEFAGFNVSITQATLSPDEESSEPVYQLMLKLWTMRRLVRLAVQNGLVIEENLENRPNIRALRTTAYINDGNEKPYLLEFPVLLRFRGTMAQFISFAKELQKNRCFLPIKGIEVYSEPPKDFPAGKTERLSELHFKIVCSAFFVEPQTAAATEQDKVVSPQEH